MAKFDPNWKTLYEDDFCSEEFLYICFSMLESRGYHGLIELMSIIEDPEKIMKIIYLFNGMQIKIPRSKEFAETLKSAAFSFCRINGNLFCKNGFDNKQLTSTLNIKTDEEFERLNKIYKEWILYMQSNGYYIQDYLKIKNKTEKTNIEKTQKIYKPLKKHGAVVKKLKKIETNKKYREKKAKK